MIITDKTPHEEIPILPEACDDVRVHMGGNHGHASYGSASSQSSSCKGTKSSGELRTLTLAICLTSIFFMIELLGGYLARSLAIMSDAAHLLSDLAGLLISLVAISVARIPASALMSFGFVRAEVLGAFVSLLVIWSLTIVLVICAIQRLFAPAPVDGPLMLALGVIALSVNILLAFVLGHSHSHEHGHAHSHFHHLAAHSDHHAHEECTHAASSSSRSWRDIFFGDDIASVNIRAAYLHVLGDLLQSIGVVIAALVITFFPALKFIDPLCTLFFAGLVFMTTRGLAMETLGVLMEGSPSHISLSAVHDVLTSIKGVAHVGDFHVWSITPRRPALSVHLYKDKMAHEHVLLKEAQAVLKERFGITHATIQINCKEAQCCNENGLREDGDKCLSTKDLASLPL